jgi:hypothetical protein
LAEEQQEKLQRANRSAKLAANNLKTQPKVKFLAQIQKFFDCKTVKGPRLQALERILNYTNQSCCTDAKPKIQSKTFVTQQLPLE